MTIDDIIARAGGATAISEASQRTRRPVSRWAVYKWPQIGIPGHHFRLVSDLARIKIERIVEANDALPELGNVVAGREHRPAA